MRKVANSFSICFIGTKYHDMPTPRPPPVRPLKPGDYTPRLPPETLVKWCKTTAQAAATFNESVPRRIGMVTCLSQIASQRRSRPCASFPNNKPTRGPRMASSSRSAASSNTVATSSNPPPPRRQAKSPAKSADCRTGIWKAVPIETRKTRRENGSADLSPSTTASIPHAQLVRRIPPRFSGS